MYRHFGIPERIDTCSSLRIDAFDPDLAEPLVVRGLSAEA